MHRLALDMLRGREATEARLRAEACARDPSRCDEVTPGGSKGKGRGAKHKGGGLGRGGWVGKGGGGGGGGGRGGGGRGGGGRMRWTQARRSTAVDRATPQTGSCRGATDSERCSLPRRT